MKRLTLITILIILYAPLCFSMPGIVKWKLTWTANTEADLASYSVYYRTATQVFADARKVDVGKVIQYNLDTIPTNNYLTVTAKDTSGNESDFADEIFFSKDQVAPAKVGGLGIVQQ